ncbi:DedA family protein [Falsirhodobacter halotolerans]|uniref:DedA family protein n=1 Tax=Falsirhodobacter halotolerans TaxID=1146892 RepID=UPI001FD009D5|nr:DedA family protein [Falsirhodobacter halotolerans]MCJ8139480.1 DedA family protein [Falsirhodobacter halotolerans]
MEQMIDSVIGFVEAHSAWAFWIALFFALAETMPVISILIPSTAILVGVGALAATGGVDLFPIWAGGSIGAVLGSTVSWWLGRRYGLWILSQWPMSRDPLMAERGRAAFAKWGGSALLIGHFFGPLRAVVFLLAGISRMPFLRFSGWNFVGSLAWAFVIPKSGEIGGNVLGWLWSHIVG